MQNYLMASIRMGGISHIKKKIFRAGNGLSQTALTKVVALHMGSQG